MVKLNGEIAITLTTSIYVYMLCYISHNCTSKLITNLKRKILSEHFLPQILTRLNNSYFLFYQSTFRLIQ